MFLFASCTKTKLFFPQERCGQTEGRSNYVDVTEMQQGVNMCSHLRCIRYFERSIIDPFAFPVKWVPKDMELILLY